MSSEEDASKFWPPDDWADEARDVVDDKERAAANAANVVRRREEQERRWREEQVRRELARRELTKEEIAERVKQSVKEWERHRFEEELAARRASADRLGFALAEKYFGAIPARKTPAAPDFKEGLNTQEKRIQQSDGGEVAAPNDAGHTAGGTRPHFPPTNTTGDIFPTLTSLPPASNTGVDHTRKIIEKLFALVPRTYLDRVEREAAARCVRGCARACLREHMLA